MRIAEEIIRINPLPKVIEESEFVDSKGEMHKGVLKMDATCADAEVRYPVDVDIIHDGCKVVDRYVLLCQKRDEVH